MVETWPDFEIFFWKSGLTTLFKIRCKWDVFIRKDEGGIPKGQRIFREWPKNEINAHSCEEELDGCEPKTFFKPPFSLEKEIHFFIRSETTNLRKLNFVQILLKICISLNEPSLHKNISYNFCLQDTNIQGFPAVLDQFLLLFDFKAGPKKILPVLVYHCQCGVGIPGK